MSNRVDDNDPIDSKHNISDGETKGVQYNNHIKKSQDLNKFVFWVLCLFNR